MIAAGVRLLYFLLAVMVLVSITSTSASRSLLQNGCIALPPSTPNSHLQDALLPPSPSTLNLRSSSLPV